jgi:hypothetical protein
MHAVNGISPTAVHQLPNRWNGKLLLYNYGPQGNWGLVRSYKTEIFMAKFVADTPDVISQNFV